MSCPNYITNCLINTPNNPTSENTFNATFHFCWRHIFGLKLVVITAIILNLLQCIALQWLLTLSNVEATSAQLWWLMAIGHAVKVKTWAIKCYLGSRAPSKGESKSKNRNLTLASLWDYLDNLFSQIVLILFANCSDV